MTFVERTDWQNWDGEGPAPAGIPRVRAEDVKRWERGIAEAHEAVFTLPVAFAAPSTYQVLPNEEIACYGESTTASSPANWPQMLSNMLRIPVVNRGISGQGPADVLTRQGGVRPRVTVAGNSIPATGSVAVTAIDPARGWRVSGTGTFDFAGSLAGVDGKLIHDLSTGAWSFTRTADGAATPVPAGTVFQVSPSLRNPTDRLVLWTGRNNVGELDVVRDLLGLGVTTGIETQVRKYVILGLINGMNEGPESVNYKRIIDHNERLQRQWGDSYLDIRSEFLARGLELAEVTPTTEDLAAVADGRPPASLMADNVHPNSKGYTAIAYIVADKLNALGWVGPVVKPGQMLTSDSFNRADTAPGALGTTDAAFGGTPLPWRTDAQLQVINNQAGHVTVSSTRVADVDVGTPDQYVEITLAATVDAGVVARKTDSNNYYTARSFGTGKGMLDVRAAGTTVPLEETADGLFQVGDKIGLLCDGDQIVVYRNGLEVLRRTDTRVTTGNRAGIRSAFSNAASRIEDFKVASSLL